MKVKSKRVGYVLAFFLGGFGIHAFYYRKYVRGFLYLLFSWTYIPVFLGFLDMLFIKYWHNSFEDKMLIQLNHSNLDTQKGDSMNKNNRDDHRKLFMNEQKKTGEVNNDEQYQFDFEKGSIEKSPIKDLFTLKISKNRKMIENSQYNFEDYDMPLTSEPFYNEDDIILEKYMHIETTTEILIEIEEVKYNYYSSHNYYNINYHFNDYHFLLNSLDYASEKGIECPEMQFHTYRTTFDQLSEDQKKWYFYWRGQALKGNYLEVDLSYIYLFVYELINYSFNQKAAFNISMLVRLHERYSGIQTKLNNFLSNWIADMLREVGEIELSEEWDSSAEIQCKFPLYKNLSEQQDLTRISISVWKPHIKYYNPTKFFAAHKNKIYKVFKNSLPLLQEVYEKQEIQLIDHFFEIQSNTYEHGLYSNAVLGRKRKYLPIQEQSVQSKDTLNEQVTALFRLSENVARLLNGEKRQIKVAETVLPEGFKELMLAHFSSDEKYSQSRFKVVQEANTGGAYGTIPSRPEEVEIPQQRPSIQFDNEKIKEFQAETEELIELFNEREIEDESLEINFSKQEKDVLPEIQHTTFFENTVEKASVSSGNLFALEDGDVEEEEFIDSLNEKEKEFLLQFIDGLYNRQTANAFLKKKGAMLAVFISEINEKANEFLGDNLLEIQDDEIVVYEEFEKCIATIKETV